MLDYYLHTALAAGKHIPAWTAAEFRPPPVGPPACAPPVSTLRQGVAWLEAERANLQAATSYAAASRSPMHAIAIPAAITHFLGVRGYWDQSADMHQIALTAACEAGIGPARLRLLCC